MGVELLQEQLGVVVVVGVFGFERVALVDVGQDALLLHGDSADADHSALQVEPCFNDLPDSHPHDDYNVG